MRKINFLLLLSFVFIGLQINAQELKLEDQLPIDSKVKIGKLENGLTYYIRHNEKPEDKIELRLVVNAGSILETDKQLGLAHFMEHMNFNGTENFKKNDLVDYLQSIGVKFGADLNAYTSFDETVYILPIPSDDPEKLEKGFQILEDWAHLATLEDTAIDDERGVVLEEYRLGLGAEKRMMRDYLPKLMHGSQYADRLPIGTKEVLENFTYEDLRSYYKDWYRPDLMAVIAVGDLPVEEMEKKIKEHFSGIEMPENPKERKEFDLPNHEETFISITSDKETAFNRIQIYYKDRENAKPIKQLKDYRQSIVEELFATMLNNRFSEIANEPDPPFVFASGYHGGTFARSKEAYSCYAMCSPEKQLDALKTILVENKRIQDHGFIASEMERAKKSILARMEKSYNDRDKMESNRLLGEYIRNYLEEEPIPGIKAEFGYYKRFLPEISLEEVSALINDFIHEDNRVILLMSTEKEGVPKHTEEEVKALLKEVEEMDVEPYTEEAVAESLMKEMPKAGAIAKTEKNEELGTTTLELSNGAKVTYKKTDFKNDEVLFQAYSPGGNSLIDLEELKKSNYALMFVNSTGVAGMKPTELQKFKSGKIYNVNASVGTYEEGFNGTAAPKDLEYMFQMIHLLAADLNKDEEAYQSNLTRMKGFIGNFLSMPSMYFNEEVSEYRNKGNERHFGFPTVEKLDAADYELAYKQYRERFADIGDFHFFFIGNIDEEKIKEYSKTYIASLPSIDRSDEPKYSDFRPKDEKDQLIVKRGNDPKSSVRIQWEEEVNYEDVNKLAAKALGEALTIKLIEKLREEESGVYGVGASSRLSKYPYGKFSLSISFPCGPENVDKLTEAALAEVEKIKENGIEEDDLQKVKENMLVQYKEDTKTNRFWLTQLVRAEREGNDPNDIMEFEEKVKALKGEEIHEIAKAYLDENYFQAILMPEDEGSE